MGEKDREVYGRRKKQATDHSSREEVRWKRQVAKHRGNKFFNNNGLFKKNQSEPDGGGREVKLFK